MYRYLIKPIVLVVLGALLTQPSAARDWDPIDPSILQLSEPRLDPDADAEALFWQVWLEDRLLGGSQPQTMETHYLRIKLFTERGVEEQTTIDVVEASADIQVTEIRGRTIKPDGTIVELERADVFERSVAKTDGLKVSMRSFSMPNVEVGDIIEYQWVEYRDNTFVRHQRIECQREIPSWSIVYRVKPLGRLMDFGYLMYTQDFGCGFGEFTSENYGLTRYSRMDVTDTPAYRTEPSMPPELDVRKWALVYYSRDADKAPAKYWPDYGKNIYEDLRLNLRIDNVVKQTADRVVGDAGSDQEKMARLRAFCLDEIQSVSGDWSNVSDEQLANWEPNKKPSDTLGSGLGTSRDIQLLYIALASAAGLDARVALASRRDQRLSFDVNFLNDYFLDTFITATNVDGKWVFLDLSNPYIEPGMLNWVHEGVAALIASPKPKDAELIQTDMSAPARTTTRREGTFDLLADGSLVGRVVHTYTGHAGLTLKLRYDGLSEQERQNLVAETVRDRLPGAEVSEIGVMNADTGAGTFSYTYSVRVPGYAAVTGRRIFLQPNFGKRNVTARFTVNEREFDVYFRYGSRDIDSYTINLPEGFTLETPEAPGSFATPNVGSYQVQISQTDDGKVVYHREFTWGEQGTILFPKSSYPQLKGVFDKQHLNDQHMLTVSRAAE